MSLHLSLHLSGLLTAQPPARAPRPAHRSFRLTREAPAPLSVAEQVRPALVLREQQGRALLAAAAREDVTRGGCLSAGPAGVQVWSRPFDGPDGSPGHSELLGSVDWTYDTPVRHHLTVDRVVVTVAGARRGLQAGELLRRVLLTGGVEGDTEGTPSAPLPAPPTRDPFRAALRRQQPQATQV